MKSSLLVSLLVFATACGSGESTPDAGADLADAFIPTPRGSFPDGFLWGTAIAPYQVEGNLHGTDWYQWETLCASCSGESADDGPDFWTHYDEDFANAAAISTNAIRLGIDWSRVFPTKAQFEAGEPDADAVAHYHDIIDAARSRSLDVMVTLIHFALPTWIQDLNDLENASGWEDPAMQDLVGAYAAWAATEFGDDVDYWVTINEPFVNVVGGWVSGDVPPGKSFDIEDALAAGENMMWAHARAYDAIHEADVTDADGDGVAAAVSIAKHQRVFLPMDPDEPKDVRATNMLRYLLNEVFLRGVVFGSLDRNYDFDYDDPDDLENDPSLSGRLDYIGLNYYGVTLVVGTNDNQFPMIGIPFMNDLDRHGLEGPMSDFGWTIYPQGLRTVIDELLPYGLPIIITENGVADAEDVLRPRFLLEHLYVINQAIDDGIDIDGYFHWSLIDNFEWGSGYCPRFGLYRVDFDSAGKTRTMGEGAQVYQQIIQDGTVSPELFATYPEYGLAGICPRVGL